MAEDLAPAPFHAEVAQGPAGGHAVWAFADGGVALRLGVFPQGAKGTVFLLPGRTEYIEKYGQAAAELQARGYASLCIDFRGQGLSARAHPDRMLGHVGHFDEYQRDLDAMLRAARALSLPEPYHLLSHSMGGAIALRALYRGLPFAASVFSAPMWGILLAPWIKPFANTIGTLAGSFGQSLRYAPGTAPVSYVLTAPMQGNVLTTDPGMWAYMRAQLVAHPDLALGGPSIAWVHAALRECAALSALPAPDAPALTALGTSERVVDVLPVHLRMAGWAKATLDLYPGAEHEVMMEAPAHRTRFYDSASALFDRHTG